MKLSFLQRLYRLLAINMIIAAVPYHHRTAAVLSLGDDAFEIFVFHWVIFDFDGEMFFAALPGKSFRQRP